MKTNTESNNVQRIMNEDNNGTASNPNASSLFPKTEQTPAFNSKDTDNLSASTNNNEVSSSFQTSTSTPDSTALVLDKTQKQDESQNIKTENESDKHQTIEQKN